MQVSIIVCTYNRAQLLPPLLARLRDELEGVDGEVVVVDNASTDETAAVVAKSAPGARYVLESAQGLSNARNRGAAEAHGEILVYLDDDALPRPGWLQAHLAPFADPVVGAVGGPITVRLPDGMKRPGWLSPLFDPALGAHDLGAEQLDYDDGVAVPPGGNMSFRREALAEAGPFDPELGRLGDELLSGEEFEVLHRLIRNGRRAVYAPGAAVEHLVPADRLRLSYFRERFRQGYRSSAQLAALGFGHTRTRAELRHLAANIVYDIAKGARRDRVYHLTRLESHSRRAAALLLRLPAESLRRARAARAPSAPR